MRRTSASAQWRMVQAHPFRPAVTFAANLAAENCSGCLRPRVPSLCQGDLSISAFAQAERASRFQPFARLRGPARPDAISLFKANRAKYAQPIRPDLVAKAHFLHRRGFGGGTVGWGRHSCLPQFQADRNVRPTKLYHHPIAKWRGDWPFSLRTERGPDLRVRGSVPRRVPI